MNIWEINKLVLFLAFFIPGFVSLKAYGLLFPYSRRDAANQLLDAIAYSSINYAILIAPIYFFNKNQKLFLEWVAYAFYFFVFLIAPVLWVILLKAIRNAAFVQTHFPHPIDMPWDYVFQKRVPYWIIATLKDGSKVAGKYAENSFVSNFPSKEQIYLEETWVLNKSGGFERARNNSSGTIIVTSEITHLELFKYNQE